MKASETKNTNTDNTMGFMSITDFKGQKTTIDLDYLEQTLLLLKALKKIGFEQITVGIENDNPLLLFLSGDSVFGVAPRIKED